MTSPSTVCPSCGEDVPFGRRTCEACGANLAVAVHEETAEAEMATDANGWDVRKEVVFEPYPEPEPAVAWAPAPDADEQPSTTAASEPAASEPEQAFESQPVSEPEPAFESQPASEPEPAPAEPASAQGPAAPGAAGVPFMPPVLREWNPGTNVPETGFATELAAATGDSAALAGAWLPPAAGVPMPAPRASAPARVPDPTPPASVLGAAADTVAPGALPASLAEMLERSGGDAPRWPSAGDRAGSLDAGTGAPASTSMAAAVPAAMAAAPTRPLEPGRAPLFADLPFDAPSTVSGWLIAAGGGLATIGFLLPWVAVLGSDYFSAWGLGSIANLPAFLLVFGVTALAILPSRLADWLRHGILGLSVGAFVLGLTWSRLVGASGGQIGVVLEGAGALLLIVGGILAIVRDRGGSEGRTGPR